MNDGIFFCTRYAFPPNILHLCGPERQTDLEYYHRSAQLNKQTKELLVQFKTLYPYLCLIGRENRRDPFDLRVVEAYWLGNTLLEQVNKRQFIDHLDDDLLMKKRLSKKDHHMLMDKISFFGLPHHAFHVLHVYARTGHIVDRHTVATMDACLINWGKVVSISPEEMDILTRGLVETERGIHFGPIIKRKIVHGGILDIVVKEIVVGDIVSYHWGKLCTRLTAQQLRQLAYYTHVALGSQVSKSILL